MLFGPNAFSSRLLAKNVKIKIYETLNIASCAIWLGSLGEYLVLRGM